MSTQKKRVKFKIKLYINLKKFLLIWETHPG